MRRLRVEGPESLEELVALYKQETNRHIRQRLQALIFIKEDRTAIEVAALLKLHPDTIRDYVHRYNREGLASLQPRFKGRSRRMTKTQEEQFQQRVSQGTQPEDEMHVLHGLEWQRILAEEFGIQYALSSVYVVLHRLGFSSLCPRPRHPKGNPELQESFKKGGDAPTPVRGSNAVSRSNAGSLVSR